MNRNNIMIFDGDCGFCNKTIIALAKIDKNDNFVFISNKSLEGLKILNNYELSKIANETIILISGKKIYFKSRAIIYFFEKINYCSVMIKLSKIFPLKFNDYIYSLISKNRNKIIKNNCTIPPIKIMKKIINK